ncbi:MAG: hypothetical protein AB7S50_12315 [Bacteroidales bacterium]
MKTIKLFFIGLAVLSLGLFTSCEDDEVTTGPTIKFVTGTGVTTADATVAAYSEVKFSCLVEAGSSDLVSFDIKEDNVTIGDDYPINSDDDIFDKASFTANATVVIAGPGTYTYTFIATDEAGLTDIKTIVITAGTNINTYTDKIIGANQNTTLGSSFASIDGTIYKAADAATNSAKIDFVYYYGATNLATLAAPNNADAQTIFTAMSGWTTINATKFGATTITATAFDAIDSDTEIIAAADGLTDTDAKELLVGDVIAFVTASTSANASKKGLIKVVAITPENTGTITIAVKVQK